MSLLVWSGQLHHREGRTSHQGLQSSIRELGRSTKLDFYKRPSSVRRDQNLRLTEGASLKRKFALLRPVANISLNCVGQRTWESELSSQNNQQISFTSGSD
jgi:hypothetical protein